MWFAAFCLNSTQPIIFAGFLEGAGLLLLFFKLGASLLFRGRLRVPLQA